ncbi:MAG: Riboflavin biosynthesis protein RibD [Bacteroidetes bacterium]|nr:Riboflavin biosynthesis protein RibD [Bacteroidota bacterium]
MWECFRLAEKGKGFVSPNPMVGAVLVRNGRIVARGFHRRFGGPHAEVECLRFYDGNPKGATLYVNLEPCSHQGKTPPCADMIIQSGVSNVVIGMRDPNPLVAGRGIRKLRRAGVRVLSGVLEREAKELNRIFVTHITRRRPFVHVKIAQSFNGKIASAQGSQTWMSGIQSRRLVHQWRAEHDAILVGANTIRIDDPLLTVRLVKGRNPAVVIIDGSLSISPESKVLKTTRKRKVVILTWAETARRRNSKMKELTSRGAIVVPLVSRTNRLSLNTILKKLYRLDIGSILVEGGSNVFAQFLEKGNVDLLSIFLVPLFIGKGVPTIDQINGYHQKAVRISPSTVSSHLVGEDILLQFRFDREG